MKVKRSDICKLLGGDVMYNADGILVNLDGSDMSINKFAAMLDKAEAYQDAGEYMTAAAIFTGLGQFPQAEMCVKFDELREAQR